MARKHVHPNGRKDQANPKRRRRDRPYLVAPSGLRFTADAQSASDPRVTSPEARLCLAVLNEAWHALGMAPLSKARRGAWEFFLGPNDPRAPLSREKICALLGIDEAYLGKLAVEKLLDGHSSKIFLR